jgi:hypothetical protein
MAATERWTVTFPTVVMDEVRRLATERDRSVAAMLRILVRDMVQARTEPAGGLSTVEPINYQIRPSEEAVRLAMAGEITSQAACASHGGFTASPSNALRCSRCGGRKAEHR